MSSEKRTQRNFRHAKKNQTTQLKITNLTSVIINHASFPKNIRKHHTKSYHSTFHSRTSILVYKEQALFHAFISMNKIDNPQM
jgi:uncharacterized protein (UPF0147 family)